ncbi:hypothetical protein NLJ89_g1917 [Agrocybe chaxingu]|uniref:Dihydroxyacetone kinase n=1 Tax=Agrocybe chaxingu TaxID=84603 RepID=A0A9W8TEC8_9AGAR|nr:hypothetical protein NLJ89_g1917 [Agrocybe chaxingu]
MPGFSITLLLLPTEHEADSPAADYVLTLLDDKPDVPGWEWCPPTSPGPLSQQDAAPKADEISGADLGGFSAPDPRAFVDGIKSAAEALIKAEPEITRMDSIAGDGDCGLTLKAGAEGVLAKIESGDITGQDIPRSIITIAQVAEEAMGGTSGALYSIFFSGLSQGLHANASRDAQVTPQVWAKALKSALDKLYGYTRARPPSRTLVDPLEAFIQTYAASNQDYVKAVTAAAEAADHTKTLDAKAGRSAYVEGDRLKKEQIPDPGAWGVKVILENLSA